MSRSTVVKARSGLAFNVAAGERFRVVDVAGQQVSDLVAFVREDLSERFSQANTRKLNGVLKLHKGHTLYSTRCRKLLTLVEDTVGEHDILFSSCSSYDYRVRFGLSDPHESCLALLAGVLAPHGITEAMVPDPFNIFQHSHIAPDFKLSTQAPLSRAGDYVEFVADADCLVALTACPQDQNPCNGFNITDIKVEWMA
jgi:uncharacterized protein YcgI (DUF1989 family)